MTKAQFLNEPSVAYGKKRITFYNSIEEMQADRYKNLAKLTPQQNLATLSRNRKLIFKDILLSDGNIPFFEKALELIRLDYEL